MGITTNGLRINLRPRSTRGSSTVEFSRRETSASGLAFFTQKPSRHLYGNVCQDGIAAEWHNSSLDSQEQSQGGAARLACSLFLCLNLSGHGSVQLESGSFTFAPQEAFLYGAAPGRMQICRCEQQQHCYVLMEFSPCFLREQLGVCPQALHPRVRSFLCSNTSLSETYPPIPLTSGHQHLIWQLLHASEDGEQGQLRSKGILLQLMADFLLRPCCKQRVEWSRKKSLASERTQKVVVILQRDLADPPTLEELGREVGCSPYYLSRTFSREMGVTIQLYMRTLRICRAAALLREGWCNVTEAAMATGYSSLSHFSQAFLQTMGCCPTDYALQSRITQKRSCGSALVKEFLQAGGGEQLVFPTWTGSGVAH